jgi:REP element-mobilizing transposase RayT
MTNQPRQYHEGYWYHVYARSIEEVSLFKSDAERKWFLEKLDSIFQRRRLKLGALCLLNTHYHVLVKMGPVSLDKALNGLHSSYVNHVNSERSRNGSLFWGRPGTDIILDNSYLLQVVSYIHSNPIEAGLVSDPRNYPWHTDELYRTGSWDQYEFDSWEFPPHFKGEDRRQTYLERFEEDKKDLSNQEGFIGTEEEWKKLENRENERKDRHRDRRDRPSMDEIVEDILIDDDTSVEALKEPGRSQPEAGLRQTAMVQMYREGYGPTEIGEFFNRNKGSVVYAVQKAQDK